MWFASDNTGPARAGGDRGDGARRTPGYAASYGADAAMARVTARIREIFEAPEAAVYLVATGTAANALALACLCPPWATVYCHRNAHVAGGRVRGAGVLHRRRQADAARRRARADRRRRAWSGRWR